MIADAGDHPVVLVTEVGVEPGPVAQSARRRRAVLEDTPASAGPLTVR